MTKRLVQTTALQLMFLFFLGYILINAIVTIYYLIHGYEVFGPPGKNDSVYYHEQATLIGKTGDFSYANLPYEYLVGLVYYLFGVTLGPYAFKLFICFIASINVYLLVSILGQISIQHHFDRRVFNKWTKIICMLLIIYPTYDMYILNMYRDIILVNGALVFLYSFLNIFLYGIKKPVYYYILVASMLYEFILRPYFGALMVLTLLAYLFSNKKYRTFKNFSILFAGILLVGVMLGFTEYGIFGMNYISALANLESVSNYRTLSSVGNQTLNIKINFHNPIQFLYTYLYAFVVNHIFPFPSYFRGLSSAVILLENCVIIYMFLSLFKRLKGKMKTYKELKFLLIFYFLNVGFIVCFSDNMGTNIRLRMSFVICLFIMFFISKQYRVKGDTLSGSVDIENTSSH